MFEKLVLKRNEDRRIRAGHLWIYSNEVDNQKTPLKSFAAGQLVTVHDTKGNLLGSGYVNPHSLICCRVYARKREVDLSVDWLVTRFEAAKAMREQFYQGGCYRWVYGESDGCPGVVIDRFNDLVVVQINTASMEARLDLVTEAVIRVLPDATIFIKNTSSLRPLEGLPLYEHFKDEGQTVDEISLVENGVSFSAPLTGGQKTGWYYDHQYARQQVAPWVANKSVLDLFSYVGGWGVQMACAGASQVTCVDASESAIGYVQKNAALNGKSDIVVGQSADVFDWLGQAAKIQATFDVVIADPPAFIKRRKDHASGKEAYQRLFRMALNQVNVNGIFVAASCSMHFSREDLRDAVRRAALKLNRDVRIIAEFGQSPDHPVHPVIPETQYLKTLVCAVGENVC